MIYMNNNDLINKGFIKEWLHLEEKIIQMKL